MALGDELGADDEVVVAARHRLQFLAQALDAPRRVGGEDEAAGGGEESFGLLGDALDAGAAGGQRIGLMALRAEGRARFEMAAMVAHQRLAEAVLDQPSRAVRALEAMAAGAAKR